MSVNSNQLKNILIFSFLSSKYYYLGRHIDIKSIKLFDCLQCLSFPSMRENDKLGLISTFNLFASFCCGCANNIYSINEVD